MSKRIEFELRKDLKQGTRKLAAGWTIDVRQDIMNMSGINFSENSNGVTIIPYTHDGPYSTFAWRVVGEEQQDGRIKVVKDETKTIKKNVLVSKENFETTYFAEAL